MIRWYADNSELQGIWAAEIPDILLYGGICMSDSSRYQLESIIASVKAHYDPCCDFPLKWNFQDLRNYYGYLNPQLSVISQDVDVRTSTIDFFNHRNNGEDRFSGRFQELIFQS